MSDAMARPERTWTVYLDCGHYDWLSASQIARYPDWHCPDLRSGHGWSRMRTEILPASAVEAIRALGASGSPLNRGTKTRTGGVNDLCAACTHDESDLELEEETRNAESYRRLMRPPDLCRGPGCSRAGGLPDILCEDCRANLPTNLCPIRCDHPACQAYTGRPPFDQGRIWR